MRRFFAETWMYILAPMVLMLLVVVYLLVFDDSPTPFIYTIF